MVSLLWLTLGYPSGQVSLQDSPWQYLLWPTLGYLSGQVSPQDSPWQYLCANCCGIGLGITKPAICRAKCHRKILCDNIHGKFAANCCGSHWVRYNKTCYPSCLLWCQAYEETHGVLKIMFCPNACIGYLWFCNIFCNIHWTCEAENYHISWCRLFVRFHICDIHPSLSLSHSFSA